MFMLCSGQSTDEKHSWKAAAREAQEARAAPSAGRRGKPDAPVSAGRFSKLDVRASPGKIPLVGYFGPGMEARFYKKPIELDASRLIVPSTPSTIARVIADDSLGCGFKGWLVVYEDLRLPPTPDLIGKVCCVLLEDGRLLVKRLEPGEIDGRFDLIGLAPPIRDVGLVWAAPIKTILPPESIVSRKH